LHTRRKFLVKEIDECLKLEAVKQMKKELELLQAKMVANIEKELKAASDKGEEERGAVIAGANELIACIYADAKRLHVKSANVVGRAEEMCTALEAKAKAKAAIVERAMPESMKMRNEAEVDCREQPTSVAKKSEDGADEVACITMDAPGPLGCVLSREVSSNACLCSQVNEHSTAWMAGMRVGNRFCKQDGSHTNYDEVLGSIQGGVRPLVLFVRKSPAKRKGEGEVRVVAGTD
jgi:hypothetical protein